MQNHPASFLTAAPFYYILYSTKYQNKPSLRTHSPPFYMPLIHRPRGGCVRDRPCSIRNAEHRTIDNREPGIHRARGGTRPERAETRPGRRGGSPNTAAIHIPAVLAACSGACCRNLNFFFFNVTFWYIDGCPAHNKVHDTMTHSE